MPRGCDEDSGRSSCSAASITLSPTLEDQSFGITQNHNRNDYFRTHEKLSHLKVSTQPRSHLSVVMSPGEKDPFPSSRATQHKRAAIFNLFDSRARLSHTQSIHNIATSTQIEPSNLQCSAVSLSAINADEKNNKEVTSNKIFRRGKPVQRAASRLYKAESLKGKEKCTGPEFIVRASQPLKHLDLSISSISEKKIINVVLLNGQQIEVVCDPNFITAGQLFEGLVHSEKYEHNFMLGIAILIGGDFVFLPDDYKIKKVAPDSWSKSNIKKSKMNNNDDNISVTLFLRIKFFLPKNIANNIQGGEWRNRVYLQLRRATLEGQMISTLQNLILLAGYALHIEFGEFSYREHGTADYFLLEHYLPEFLITTDMSDIKLRMKRAHESRRGLDKDKAIVNYITLAQTFRDYGAHFYSAIWATRDGFCREIWFSIGPRGITLYSRSNPNCDESNPNTNRIVLQSLPWHHIHTFYYNKKSLYIMPNAYSGLSKIGIKYKLKMAENKSYFTFWLASLHHRLYLKLYAKEDFINYLSSELNYPLNNSPKKTDCSNYQDSYNLAVRNPIKARRPVRRRFKMDLFGDKKLHNKENHNPDTEELLKRILLPQYNADISSCSINNNSHMTSSNEGLSTSESSLPRRHGVKMGTRVFSGTKSTFVGRYSSSPRKNCPIKSESDLVTAQSDSDELSGDQKQCYDLNRMDLLPERPYSQNKSNAPTAYVLGSPKAYSDTFNYNETVNESSLNNSIFEKLENMEYIQGERVFVTASLERDKMNALGLQVAEGSDGNVYIKSITPGGAADLCKKLLPGDQIISVNGQTLLNIKYDLALCMLQSAPKNVELIVLQNASKTLTNSEFDDAHPENLRDEVKLKRYSIASALDVEITDDELLNEEALKTVYALIKLTKEKVISRIKDKSSRDNINFSSLQKCCSENKVYDDLIVSRESNSQRRSGVKFNTWRGQFNNNKAKRRPLSLSVPVDVHLPENYLNDDNDDLYKKSSLKSIQLSINNLEKSTSYASVKNVALPRTFGFGRKWLGPVKYPVTPCKNSCGVDSAPVDHNVVRRHFVYGVGDSDEDQIFL